jgi:hypothetical protein
MADPKKGSLFSRIESRDDALATIKGASTGFFVVAALQAALSFLIGSSVLIDAAAFVVLAFLLRRYRSRVAAVLLLVLAVLTLGATVASKFGVDVGGGGGTNVFLAILVLILAVRAVEATFKLRSLPPPSPEIPAPPKAEIPAPPKAFGPNAPR